MPSASASKHQLLLRAPFECLFTVLLLLLLLLILCRLLCAHAHLASEAELPNALGLVIIPDHHLLCSNADTARQPHTWPLSVCLASALLGCTRVKSLLQQKQQMLG